MAQHFVGKYVDEFSRAARASALSGLNLFVIGEEPGTGKTELSQDAARQMFGEQHTLFVNVDPTTEPTVIKGGYDGDEALKGRYVQVTDGTPYDPNILHVVYDELSRASDPLHDSLLPALDMKTWSHAIKPVAFATGNWIPKNKRTAAMIDRFGMFFPIPDEEVDSVAFDNAHLKSKDTPLTIDFDFPTLDEIIEVRNTSMGDNAIKAINELIDEKLADMAQGYRDGSGNLIQSFRKLNRRRRKQWLYVLSSVGLYISGINDFNEVPLEASECLKWCWRATTEEELWNWQRFIEDSNDQVSAQLDRLTSRCYRNMVAVAEQYKDSRGTLLPTSECIRELGKTVADGLEDVEQLCIDAGLSDELKVELVGSLQGDLQLAYARVIRGEDPFNGI